MIPDNQTNTLYLAGCLPQKQPAFYKRFCTVLKSCGMQHNLLPHTKDIWARDYMPIQIREDTFVRFVYDPDYLQGARWQATISDVDTICNSIGLQTIKSNIKVDGGNVIRTKNKVILCDKVFGENPSYTKKNLIQELETLFEVDTLIFLPWHPDDYTGHADGMVRFVNENTVLINEMRYEDASYVEDFTKALKKAKLEAIEIPYHPPNTANYISAKGLYINYLELQQAVFIPTFEIKWDDVAVTLFKTVFPHKNVISVDTNEIAKEGGALNCISWNIQKEH